MQRLKLKLHATLATGIVAPWAEVRDQLNRKLRGWSAYFSYGTRTLVYRTVDNFVQAAVRHFLRRRHKLKNRGVKRLHDSVIYGELGVLRLRTVQLGPPAKAHA